MKTEPKKTTVDIHPEILDRLITESEENTWDYRRIIHAGIIMFLRSDYEDRKRLVQALGPMFPKRGRPRSADVEVQEAETAPLVDALLTDPPASPATRRRRKGA